MSPHGISIPQWINYSHDLYFLVNCQKYLKNVCLVDLFYHAFTFADLPDTGTILWMHPVIERHCYNVTLSHYMGAFTKWSLQTLYPAGMEHAMVPDNGMLLSGVMNYALMICPAWWSGIYGDSWGCQPYYNDNQHHSLYYTLPIIDCSPWIHCQSSLWHLYICRFIRHCTFLELGMQWCQIIACFCLV